MPKYNNKEELIMQDFYKKEEEILENLDINEDLPVLQHFETLTQELRFDFTLKNCHRL